MENERMLHFLLSIHLLLFIVCTSCAGKEITEKASSTKAYAFDKRYLDKLGFVDSIEQNAEGTPMLGETEYDSQLAHQLAKRRMDRFAFGGTLGKRYGESEQADDNDVDKRKMDRLSFMSNLGKRSRIDFSYFGNLGKRSRLDRHMFTGNLGKRGRMDRYSFIGNIGKRRGKMDMYSFFGNLGKRPSLDRYSFMGSLGKRGQDLFPFAEIPENRHEMNPSAGSLERNVAEDYAKSGDSSRNAEGREFGKRRRFDMKNLHWQLGKRSKRSLFFPWGSVRHTRNNKLMRGIDKYSFSAHLGKRKPDYRFLATLGKRTYLKLEDDGPNSEENYLQ